MDSVKSGQGQYLNETQRIALKGLAKVIADLLVEREVNIRSRTN